MHKLFLQKVLIILRSSTKHGNFCCVGKLTVMFPMKLCNHELKKKKKDTGEVKYNHSQLADFAYRIKGGLHVTFGHFYFVT